MWKMATSFVFTAETWLGADETREGDEALLAIGVSHHERWGLIERITGRDPVCFGLPEWLTPEQVDETYFRLLPNGASEVRRRRRRNSPLSSGRAASWRRSGCASSRASNFCSANAFSARCP